MEDIDYIFCPMGGGGIIAGVAAVVKGLKPSIKVVGVEPQGERPQGLGPCRGAGRWSRGCQLV